MVEATLHSGDRWPVTVSQWSSSMPAAARALLTVVLASCCLYTGHTSTSQDSFRYLASGWVAEYLTRVDAVVMGSWWNGQLVVRAFIVILLLSSLWFIWNNSFCQIPARYTSTASNPAHYPWITLTSSKCHESIVKHSVKREMWRVQVSSNHYNCHQSIAGPCTSGKCADIIMGGTYAIVLWTGYYNIHATGKKKYIYIIYNFHIS